MTYNVLTYPTATVDAEADVVFQSENYSWALNHVADLGIGDELRPLSAPDVAALAPYSPLQAWELRQDGHKVALLAIQVAGQEEQ